MAHPKIFSLAVLTLLIAFGFCHAQDPLLDTYYDGNYEEVIGITSDAIAAGDSSYNAYYLLALSQVQLGRTNNAIGTLEQAIKVFPEEMRFRKMLAGQYFEAGAYSEAEGMYERMMAADSSDLSSMLKLADIASFGQRYAKAVLLLRQVLDLDSTNLSGLMMMGEILTRQNNPAAMVHFEKGFRLYPNNQTVAYALGNWYIQSDMPKDAIPVCEQILGSDSTNIRFHKLLGFAFYRSGNPASAIGHFEQAAMLGDSTSFTYKYLGISRYLTMDFPGAIPPLEMAMLKDSLDADTHFFLASSLATTTRKQEAMYHLDKALKLMRPDPAALAKIYSEQGNIMRLEMEYDQAYESYRLAWEADTTNPMALYFMASILDNSLHRSREALVDYQRFIDQLDLKPESGNRNDQLPTIRGIVEDRIVQLKEELFFLDER